MYKLHSEVLLKITFSIHTQENGYVETERGKQDNLQHEQTDNTANQQMLEKNYNTNNLEDLWDELNGMQQVGTQKNAQVSVDSGAKTSTYH